MAPILGIKDFLISHKYRLIRKIGSGSFGDIYLGINISNGEVIFFILNIYCYFQDKKHNYINWFIKNFV